MVGPIRRAIQRLCNPVKNSKLAADKRTSQIFNEFIQEMTFQDVVDKRFENNYHFIMQTTDLKYVGTKDKELIQTTAPLTPLMRQVITKTIQQTYRQMMGRVIDAEHGYRIKEVEIQKLDQLRAHIMEHFPEILKESPLPFLTRSSWEENPHPELRDAQNLVRVQVDEKVKLVRSGSLQMQEMDKSIAGVNPAAFAVVEGQKVAVRKSSQDLSYGEILKQDFPESKLAASEMAQIAGINESIVSSLNHQLQGLLKVPLVTSEKGETSHVFVENQGTLGDLLDANPEITEKLDVEASQHFVFGQLVTRNTDCHADNVLITKHNTPVGIDYGRILYPQSLSQHAHSRACYLNFPCLDEQINARDLKLYQQLDIPKVMGQLRADLKREYGELSNLKELVDQSLQVLEARLIMIQEGCKRGVTQRDLVALDFPPLSEDQMAVIEDYLNVYEKLVQSKSELKLSFEQEVDLVRRAFKEAGVRGGL